MNENYEGFEWRYAETIRKHPVRLYYELPAAQWLIGDVEGQHFLDAGCGGGDYTALLLEAGAQVTACDLMPAFVQMTQERTGVRAFQADLAKPLSFARNQEFDGVISFLTLHYLADWRGVFGEFARVLKPGGRLIFSVMHPMTDTEDVPYFQTGLYETEWENFGNPKPLIQLYHRPLMAIINPLIAAGFRLEYLLEPLPEPEMAEASPAEYAFFSQKPVFLFVSAVR